PPELGRPSPTGAASAEGTATAEEGLEDVAQAATEAGKGVSHPRPLDGVGSQEVVAAPPIGIPERLVGQGHLLEAFLGRGVAWPGVGVKLPGQAPVGALEVVVAGVGRHAQQLVVVGHACDLAPRAQESSRWRPRRWLTTATAVRACG